MQTFKNGPLLKILYFLILGFSLLVSLCSTFKSFSFSTFFNDPFYYINGDFVIGIFAFLIFFFIIFFCFNYEISFDDKHLIYTHGFLKDSEEIIYSQIEKIQHHTYRNGKSTTQEYLFFVNEPLTTEPVQISLPYPDYSNRQIYKKMLRTIILANPEIKLTKLDSKYFGKVREEDMDFEDFI